MKCRQVQPLLSRHLEGRLPGRQTTAVATHLDACAGCRQIRDAFLAADADLRALPALDPPAGLRRRALERHLAERTTSPDRARSLLSAWPSSGLAATPLRLVGVSAAMASAVLLALVLNNPARQMLPTRPPVRVPAAGGWRRPDLLESRLKAAPAHAGRRWRQPASAGFPDWQAPRLRGIKVPEIAAPSGAEAVTHAYALPPLSSRLPDRDDLASLNGDPVQEARFWAPGSSAEWQRLEARVRRAVTVRDDFVTIPLPRLADQSGRLIAAAVAGYRREAAVVDARLAREVTVHQKATALSDLCDRIRADSGIHLTAARSVADEKVSIFCAATPLREIMRQLSRPFGYTWTRAGGEGAYRYELTQDLRSQLLEEELRNRDRHAALLALERDLDRYRPYLSLSPNEALSRAARAPEAEKQLLERFAGVGWAPIQIYFRLSPQDLAALRAGQGLVFSEEPKPGERTLPADLKRGVLECNRYWRLIRQADGYTGAFDSNDPKALPLTEVPEVKAKLFVEMAQSELGEFALRGSAGAFIDKSPSDRYGWGVLEGRGPYAVGRGPSFSPTVAERAHTPEPRDPALRVRRSLRPRPSGIAPTPSADGGAAPEPKVTTADVLEALHRATGLPIVADAYTRLYESKQVSAQGEPLHALLERLAATMRLRWRLEGEKPSPSAAEKRWLQIRSATYYYDRLKEVPNRLLARWAEARRRHGMLPLDDLVEIAGLTNAQLDGEEMRIGAVEWWGIPEWSLLRTGHFRSHVRFLAEFAPEQRRAMTSAEGLPFGKMTLAQQQGFLSRAIQGEPLRSFDELAGATLRVDYTRPGAFQWQQPGGFSAGRWAVRVEPGAAGRRVLIPPIRERTREAALAAARRAFPPVTPALLAAFRQSDPTLDAEQIVPRPREIFPTELDLVIVYLPGAATERTIRWVRTRQDLGG